MTTKKYVEQLERIRRLLQRFERLGEGIDHVQDSANYDDDVYSFFQNCYHLKDWIKNDPYCAGWPSVEALININQDLQLCADLCNGQKHLVLTNQRSGQNPQFDGGTTKLIIVEGSGGTSVRIANSYTVATATLGPVDALDLARRCVQIWEKFVAVNDP